MPIQGETIFIAILVLALLWGIYRQAKRHRQNSSGGGDSGASGGEYGGDGDGGGGDGGGGGGD